MSSKNNEKQGKNKNFWDRLFYGVLLVVLMVGLDILGGWYWFGLVAVFCLSGQWEFYRVFHIEKSPIGIMGYLVAIGYLIILGTGVLDLLFPAVVLAFLVLMSGYVFFFTKLDSTKVMAAFFGFIYVVVFLSFLYRIRIEKDGLLLSGFVLIAAWGTDTLAYCSGMLFGKHKMTPVLSPKKTIEGAVGGFLGAIALGALYSWALSGRFTAFANPVLSGVVITAVTSIVSMIGDLTASAFKRNHDVKDYSRLIPGHGGILDRFDSVIVVAPVLFYVFRLLTL